MKHLLAALLCLLLCGCAQETTAEPVMVSETQTSAEKNGMYDPDHPMEQSYPGEVRAYPLTMRKVHGIRVMGNDVLTLSGYGTTTLTLLTGEELRESASITLDFELHQEDPSLRIHENSLSYFDPKNQETVVLDKTLREIRRITAPGDLCGKPVLSEDQNTLYYCTPQAVIAWNLETGIRRTVKLLSYDVQELTALHLNDTVLQCRIQTGSSTENLFLAVDTGVEQNSLPEGAAITTKDSRYFAAIPAGNQTLLLFADEVSAPKMLLPQRFPDQQYYLPEDHAAVTVCFSDDGIVLDYYELNTGILRAALTLDPLQQPKNIVNSKGHSIYILTFDPDADCDILYRWDVLRQPPDLKNVLVCTESYRSKEAPDLETLDQCRKYADAIGKKYGITVRIWEDATAVQPWDYQFEAEFLAPVLQKELELLDQRLAQYPDDFLAQTTSHFTGLTICLVRQITGTADAGSLRTATGIQFFDGTDAYVVITAGKFSEQALYHELYHVMETRILTESTALDQWSDLNPLDFTYHNGYDAAQNTGLYLQGETRAFVDAYSMCYPKEDRARILEYAMLDGMEDVFRSEYMQRKLTALCVGIREAYGLKKAEETFLWEQYLVNPLAPKA